MASAKPSPPKARSKSISRRPSPRTRWRLNRARALENSIFALGQIEHVPDDPDNPDVDAALAQGRTWMDHARELNLLTTYENRIRRSVEKNMAEFRTLQRERRFAPIEEQLQPFINAQYEGGDNEPAGDPPAQPRILRFVLSRGPSPSR